MLSASGIDYFKKIGQYERTRSYAMKTLYQSSLLLIGALAVAGTVHAQNNTAYGEDALYHNDSGIFNTAFGLDALFYNFDGNYNTATGTEALFNNVAGIDNTATGFEALYGSISGGLGNYDTGTGGQALYSITTGSNDTADGYQALYSNSTGFNNNAAGFAALYNNTIGNYNEASGHVALYSNTSGSGNEASGHAALFFNTTGSYNVAVGYAAGYNQTTGSNNIYISHHGVAGESGVTRIGTPDTQTETYIAGIENAKITGSAVYVTSSGQLGVLASSERYKTRITPIGTTTEKLQQLRPVSFHLKTDPKGAVQYGLIAEEVDKVYSELVIRDDAGKIQGVRYDELAPMLLNEMQRQAAEIRGLKTQLAELNDLKQELHAAIRQLSKGELVAQR
jgi:hypothetical protein